MSEFVSSPHNSIIKLAASLKQRKKRDELGLFVAEGIRLVEDAITSSCKLQALIYTTNLKKNLRVQGILRRVNGKCRLIEVPDNIYSKISDTEQPQGIMAVLEKMEKNLIELANFEEQENLLIVVLDSVQDPGNVGALIRTADAAGCSAVIMTKGCADLFSGKTIRASMGSVFHLPVFTNVSLVELLEFVKIRKIKLLATSLESSDVYCDAKFSESVAIVFGNEGNGISHKLLMAAEKRLYIPIIGQAESLNVAAAAAIILYEAVRQRGQLTCN